MKQSKERFFRFASWLGAFACGALLVLAADEYALSVQNHLTFSESYIWLLHLAGAIVCGGAGFVWQDNYMLTRDERLRKEEKEGRDR